MPRRLVLSLIAAACVVGVLVAALVAVALLRDDDEATVVRAPDPPSDLCAVIGVDDLATWVPEAEWDAATDASLVNTEATCQVDTARGTTDDLEYGSLAARVYRYGSVGALDATEQAGEQVTQQCEGARDGDVGLGDVSCVEYAEEAAETGRAAVSVRVGADLVSVSYYASSISADDARDTAVDAAEAIVARLRR